VGIPEKRNPKRKRQNSQTKGKKRKIKVRNLMMDHKLEIPMMIIKNKRINSRQTSSSNNPEKKIKRNRKFKNENQFIFFLNYLKSRNQLSIPNNNFHHNNSYTIFSKLCKAMFIYIYKVHFHHYKW